MYSLALIIFVVSEKKAFEHFPIGSNVNLCIDPMGKCSNAFFSETTNMIKAKLYMNVHWMVLYEL
jgi:riboflavin synthase alpha subunit